MSLPDDSGAQVPEMKAEAGRWNLNCQVCGGQDDLLGCDVSLFTLPVLDSMKGEAILETRTVSPNHLRRLEEPLRPSLAKSTH